MTELVELVVLEGRKSGARVAIPAKGSTTVGVGYDCDVVLDLPGFYNGSDDGNDAAPADESVIELAMSSDGITLTVLHGWVHIDGQTFESGSQTPLYKNAEVKLHQNVFVLERNVQFPLDPGNVALPIEDTSQPGAATAMTATRVRSEKRMLIGGVQAVCGAVVLAAAFYMFKNTDSPDPVTIDQVALDVESDLESGGFNDLEVVVTEDDSIAINGYLQNRADLHQAREQVSLPEIVEWDVQVGESLAESVGSVYRVNGVTAEVEVTGEGMVSVSTATNNLDLLQRIEESLYADVSNLQTLDVVNTEPEIEQVEAPAEVIEEIPGKRIVMIVASSPNYLQTEDGSRYFEGSILPSGHMVLAILNETVQLQLGDEQIELSF